MHLFFFFFLFLKIRVTSEQTPSPCPLVHDKETSNTILASTGEMCLQKQGHNTKDQEERED